MGSLTPCGNSFPNFRVPASNSQAVCKQYFFINSSPGRESRSELYTYHSGVKRMARDRMKSLAKRHLLHPRMVSVKFVAVFCYCFDCVGPLWSNLSLTDVNQRKAVALCFFKFRTILPKRNSENIKTIKFEVNTV